MRTLLALIAWLLAAPLICDVSEAATIYRCGPIGNAYSQTPCPDGSHLKVDDSRTPEQHSQARLLAANTRDLGNALERERLDKEAAFQPPRAGSLSAPATAQFSDKPQRPKVLRIKKMRVARAPAAAPIVLNRERPQPARLSAQ